MDKFENYLSINRDSWNNKVETHLNSDFYNVEAFMDGASSLNEIELAFLTDLNGKTVLHLQCHFGQDTISLERLGAMVTGIDLSDKAIEAAKEMAEELQSKAKFICCDIYDLPNHLNQQFDYVFTSYGTIGWLPDIDKWAAIVSHYLKPGGTFVFAEFHPVIWMYDDQFEGIIYSYFKENPIIELETGSYADRSAPVTTSSITWNHGLSEVVQALINSGLRIDVLKEYNYSPYNCFHKAVQMEPKKFGIENMEGKLPMVYAVVAKKI